MQVFQFSDFFFWIFQTKFTKYNKKKYLGIILTYIYKVSKQNVNIWNIKSNKRVVTQNVLYKK